MFMTYIHFSYDILAGAVEFGSDVFYFCG